MGGSSNIGRSNQNKQVFFNEEKLGKNSWKIMETAGVRLSIEKHGEKEKWGSIPGWRKKPTSTANSKEKVKSMDYSRKVTQGQSWTTQNNTKILFLFCS